MPAIYRNLQSKCIENIQFAFMCTICTRVQIAHMNEVLDCFPSLAFCFRCHLNRQHKQKCEVIQFWYMNAPKYTTIAELPYHLRVVSIHTEAALAPFDSMQRLHEFRTISAWSLYGFATVRHRKPVQEIA